MAFNLATFRRRVHSIGRNQYFIVRIPAVGDSEIITAMARSTTLPAVAHETLPVAYRGLEMKVDNKPTFADWTVTFLCDEAHALRHVFAKWTELAYNIQNLQNLGHNEYKYDGLSVSQLAADGTLTSTATFIGAFPTNVSEIELNQEGGVLETFTVTFAYDYFVMNDLAGDVVFNDIDFAVNDDGRFSGVNIEGVGGVQFRIDA
jgi:hypothetical protein